MRTLCRIALTVAGLALLGGCATAPPPTPPAITWEDKLEWMMRLEDQRVLQAAAPAPPVVLAPATGRRPAVVAPPPPSDLLRLMRDPEARVRRRAALAAGRVGLPAAIEPLSVLLAEDDDAEVRQMAAFALGLIGDRAARPALQAALARRDPVVQGRAAEALGQIGERQDAAAVSAMVRMHIAAGALAGIAPGDLTYPLAPQVEAVRLGVYALVRLGDYEALAAAALEAQGPPVTSWWPLAYALQRIGDPRAVPALLPLLAVEGRFTAAFAARGLGAAKVAQAVEPLLRIVREQRADQAVVIQAIRALASIGDRRARDPLAAVLRDSKRDPIQRLEALTGLAALRADGHVDLLLDLMSEPWAPMRAAAARALAATDPETLLLALSGLDPDRDWTVRAAQAAALGTLPADQAQPRLLAMLHDPDQRVIPAVLDALVSCGAPGVEAILLERLGAEDFVVRAVAANNVGEVKPAGAAAALAGAYRTGQRDATYVARAAALAALAKLGPEAARPVLEEALQDRDWAVRRRATSLLREIGVTDALADRIRPAPVERALTAAEWKWLVAPPFSPHAYIETDRGTIEIELAVLDAPMAVAAFVDLARRGFFDGVAVHRVVADFVVQDGDPRGDGEGGPGYSLRDEINQRPYLRGTVGMARDWEDTVGSQFFITHSPQPHLDGRYTVVGHVVNGMDVVDRLLPSDTIRGVRVWDGVAGF